MARELNEAVLALEAEVLGGVLLDSAKWPQVAELLTEAHFDGERHKAVFRAIDAMTTAGEFVDAISVGTWLAKSRDGWKFDNGAYVTGLAANCTGANVEGHARNLRDQATAREAVRIGEALAQSNGGADAREAALQALLSLDQGSTSHEHTLKDGVKEATDELMAAMDSPDQLRGITTGFRDLDDHFGGLQQPDLIVIGARPAMGKTSLLLGMSRLAALAGHPVGVHSTEQPLLQVAQRHLASDGKVSLTRMRRGHVDATESKLLIESGRRLAGLPYCLFDKSGPSVSEVVRVARKWRSTHGIEALYLDYLQRIRAPGDTRTDQVGYVAQALKTLARELEIPVIALAQVNREVEKRHDKRPGMADLRNSGEIEQEADLIAFLYRDDVYNPESNDAGTAEIIIEKNRHGYTGTVRVGWAAEFVRFYDLDTRYTGSER